MKIDTNFVDLNTNLVTSSKNLVILTCEYG